MENKHDASIYTLAIICILAIVAIIFFVNQYIQNHPNASTIDVANTGNAYAVLQQGNEKPSIVTIIDTDPGQTYAYMRK